MVQVWKHWCRLCASSDTNSSHISVFLKDEQESLLSDAINKFFSVNRASKVQAMLAKLCKKPEQVDPEELKLNCEPDEFVDVDVVSKLLAKRSPALHDKLEDNSFMPADEPKYIEKMLVDPLETNTENTNEDDSESSDEELQPIASGGNCTDDCCSLTPASDSNPSQGEQAEDKRLPGEEMTVFNCLECKKIYQRFPSYRHHMQTKHDTKVNPRQFLCKECNKTFPTAYRLKGHQYIHFPSEKLFKCGECGKAYRTRSALKAHNVSHIDERVFKCSWCDKSFKSKVSLKRHEDTHENTKYICPSCGLQLNTQQTLQMHMVVHSDQRRHKCDYCGNEYKRAKALKNHLILHTGLKPYTCNFCEKSFASGTNCRSHKKKEHPVELAAMEATGKKIVAANVPKLKQLRIATLKKAISKRHSRITHAVFGETMSGS